MMVTRASHELAAAARCLSPECAAGQRRRHEPTALRLNSEADERVLPDARAVRLQPLHVIVGLLVSARRRHGQAHRKAFGDDYASFDDDLNMSDFDGK